MFYAINDRDRHVADDDAVTAMWAIAAGELDEAAVAAWLTEQLDD